MSKVLCREHFNNYVSDANFKNMDILYDTPQHPYRQTGIEMIIKPPTMISITKPAALKLEPRHGSKYKYWKCFHSIFCSS